MSIFDKYAKKINKDELAASQQEINDNNSGDFEEVPHGTYEVEVNKMEAKKSKSGNPMVSIWFKILKGDYKGSMIFYNGVFHEDWMRHRVAAFLNDLIAEETDHTAEINILLKGDLNDVNDFLLDVHEQIDGQLEYILNYGVKKGYNTYDIEDVFETE